MSYARPVALATLVQVAGKALALVLALASIRLVTGYLGVDGYGAYAIVLTGATIVLALADLGIPLLLAREVAKQPELADELGGRLLFLRLLSAVGILALAALVVPFLPYETEVKQGLLLATAGVLLGTVSLFPVPFFQVHLRLELAALAEVFTRAVTLALVAGVVLLDLGFLPLVATIGLGWACTLVLTFALSRRFWRVNVRPGLREAWRLGRAALPIGLVAVLGLLHFKVDALLLSFLKPAADVGIYTLAFSVFEQALVLPGLFMASVFPILTRVVHARDAIASGDVVDKSFRFLVALGLVVSAVLFALAEPAIGLLTEDGFAESVWTLRILSFAVVPLFATAIFSSLLVSVADLRYVGVVSLVGIAVNVALNLAVIPAYSYDGAAATTIASETLGLALIYAVAHRRAGARVRVAVAGRLGLLVVLTVAAEVASLLLPWWAAAPALLAVTAGACFALRVVSVAEVRLVLRPAGAA